MHSCMMYSFVEVGFFFASDWTLEFHIASTCETGGLLYDVYYGLLTYMFLTERFYIIISYCTRYLCWCWTFTSVSVTFFLVCVCLSDCRSVCLPFCLSACLSVCLFLCLSVSIFLYVSTHTHTHKHTHARARTYAHTHIPA